MPRLILILIILSSCQVRKSTLPDYSKTAYEPIDYIKNAIINSRDSFQVEIQNSHNGIYAMNSEFKIFNDSIEVNSSTLGLYTGIELDTTMVFTKTGFIKKLEYELERANEEIKIAGHYQTVEIIMADTTKLFYTRQGYGLMNLLIKGKNNYKEQ